VGPHLIQSTIPEAPTPSISTDSTLWTNDPTNLIDMAVFRGKDQQQQSGTKQKANGGSTATSSSASGNARKKSSSH
jgi:hypothetical protein